jgi:hypothetical protein
VAAPGTAVYANTSLLYNAQLPNAPTVPINQGTLYDVKEQFGLTTPDVSSLFNTSKDREKYFKSTNGSNSAHNGLYTLLPNGQLYAWAGSLAATLKSSPVADLSSEGVYADTALLYKAQPTTINDPLYQLKEQLGLYTADTVSSKNALGMPVEVFHSGNGSNAAHGGTYILLPNNKLYAWNGVSLPSTIAQPPVAQFLTSAYGNVDVFDNAAVLYCDAGQLPAIGAAVSSTGVVTIIQSPAYIGSALVSVVVSDGAETTTRSFVFTST